MEEQTSKGSFSKVHAISRTWAFHNYHCLLDHRSFQHPGSVIGDELEQNYPFTKLSEVPPDLTAVRFFASLMNTSSIPPEMTGDSLFFPFLKVFFPARTSREEVEVEEIRDSTSYFTKNIYKELLHFLTIKPFCHMYVFVYTHTHTHSFCKGKMQRF